MQNLMRRIKSQDKIAMDFNVANFVRHKNKVLALKTCYTVHYRFDVCRQKVTKNFHRWIDVMFQNLKPLVCWPNLPDCCKPHYAKTVCIINCSEVFIHKPTCYIARAQSYSNYNAGAVTFISRCWSRRVSDCFHTANSGLLRHLKHGALVIADREFDIADDLALTIPPFIKEKSQLLQREVEFSRNISSVRIHRKSN